MGKAEFFRGRKEVTTAGQGRPGSGLGEALLCIFKRIPPFGDLAGHLGSRPWSGKILLDLVEKSSECGWG